MSTVTLDLNELAAQIAKHIAQPMKKTLAHDEAASYLNISASSLDDLLACGQIPGAKISQRWVFREVDLDAYLAEHVRVQTEQRREAYQAGRAAKIKPAVSEVASCKAYMNICRINGHGSPNGAVNRGAFTLRH